MKKLLSIVFLFVFFLLSCAPSKTPTPSIFPTSTFLPTAIATERPNATLKVDTILYNGPSNIDFDSLDTMKAGDIVYPLGIYGDFVQAEASLNGNNITGFVYKNALNNLPGNISTLSADQVPWTPLYIPSCSPGLYDP